MSDSLTQWSSYVSTPLRLYQSRICNNAKGKNSIVVLPTGSGKTLIATTLAAWACKEKRAKTLFLVPTQMLVAQQGASVSSNAPFLRVALYHGELAWPTSEFDVLVSTPEAFRLKIAGGAENASFENFGFVVFDEVHHVMKKHPYRKLARLLELTRSPKPVVLGLTATCTYSVSEVQIGSDITKLCDAINISTILTASIDELKRDGYHGATPNVQISTASTHTPVATAPTNSPQGDGEIIDFFESEVPSNEEPKFKPHQSREAFFHTITTRTADPLLLRLFDFATSLEAVVKSSVPSFSSPLYSSGKHGKVTEWSSYAMKIAASAPQARILAHLYEALRLMVVTMSAGLDLTIEYLRMSLTKEHFTSIGRLAPTLQQIITDGGDVGPSGATTKYMQRFYRLVQVLQDKLSTHGQTHFRGILFVQQRITTHILKHFIDRIPSLSAHIQTACIYATAGEATPTLRVTPTQSRERVAQFAEGKVNLLISTAVAEEGMDVPAANCIIRFDPVNTPVSFVQGRGRARQADSSFVVMEERPDRTVAHLTTAEQAQRNFLASNNVVDEEQMGVARKKRALAQDSRERSARSYLETATGNPTAVVKQFCTKSDREVVETFKKKGAGWSAQVVVMGIEGEKWQAEVVHNSKQDAKNAAYSEILAKLKLNIC